MHAICRRESANRSRNVQRNICTSASLEYGPSPVELFMPGSYVHRPIRTRIFSIFLFLFSYIWFSFWRKPSLYPSPVNWDFKLKSVVNGVVLVSNGINTRFVNTGRWDVIRISSICSNFANVHTNSDDESGTPESWKRREDDIFVGPACDVRKLSYFLKRRTSYSSWIKL